MSRHRMVRNLTEDDYYDDDYYDEDDYEDYDSSYVAPKKKAPTSKATAAASTKKASATPTTTTISAKVAFAAVPKKSTTSATTTAAASSMGVVKPPPGWGKPNANTQPTTTTGVAKPPPKWGKPNITTSSSIEVPSSSSSGISKPPPGWGKPSSSSATLTTSTTETTIPSTLDAATSLSSSTKTSGTQSQQQQPYKPKPLPAFLQQKTSNAIQSQLSMVVLGHVDAGKSTLMGQLLVQTGQVSKRQVHKQGGGGNNNNNNNSNTPNLAWLLDENQSERDRGVTMEIATKALTTAHHQIVVLDAPGHADFIPIMITGAANADTAILVVDATTGEFESGFSGGGQTKEHILLAKGLGVSQIIVAINKLDVEGWNSDRYQFVQQSIVEYLLQQRFKAPRIQCVPVSGLTGENVAHQSEPRLRNWYQGPTLLQAMDRFKPANRRQLDKPLRFIITDMYAEGKGVVVRGRVVQGLVQVGNKVQVLPLGDPAVISKLEHLQPPPSASDNDGNNGNGSEDRLSVAIAGDTAELVLANIDPLRVTVGNIVVDPTHLPPIATKARAKILIMDDLKVPIIRGAQVLFHMHSLDLPASLTKLVALLKPSDGSILKERPRALTSGSSAMVELTLSDHTKIVMDTFQECRALGRFVLRRGGDTIAVGVIEQILG